jgi:hypothetical protein
VQAGGSMSLKATTVNLESNFTADFGSTLLVETR